MTLQLRIARFVLAFELKLGVVQPSAAKPATAQHAAAPAREPAGFRPNAS